MLHRVEEIAHELAKILIPNITIGTDEDSKEHEARLKALREQRRTITADLMMAARASTSEDPVLAKLDELAAQKRDIQQQMRLIVAYAREFVRPEPYRLRALAEAADMSISGARTAYTSADVATISTRIGRKDTKGTTYPARSKRSPSSVRRSPEFNGEQWWAPSDSTPPPNDDGIVPAS
ncbi:hypothetical protein AB0F17_17825 [Nonomuraea sp. NPDC026600]|uniref:hypothetical protein n=1 Tax=Nonomuraea sp. NPDC026600 TaxID=3155363 RepID=UPI003400F94F